MKGAITLTVGYLLLISACGTPARTVSLVSRSADSIYVDRIEYRDSLVTIEVPIEHHSNVLPSRDSSHLETSVAESNAWIDTSGMLHHELMNKRVSLEKRLELPQRMLYIRASTQETATIVRTVSVEKKLNTWQKVQMRGFWVFVVIALVSSICLFEKPRKAVKSLIKRLIIWKS